ncbi:MAG: hypothetical protein E7255_06830 [Lachnospiraceae bacterium]|nr:hypothetical protein [Lachnospiraceae bacterium]
MNNNEDELIDNEEDALEDINKLLGEQVKSVLNDENKNRKNRMNIKKRYLILAIAIIILIILIPIGKKVMIHTVGNYIYNKLEIDNNTYDNDNSIEKNNHELPANTNDNNYIVKNILLLGVEEFYGASNTDSIIIASLNTNKKTLKLTSLMRDLYVEIPEHDNNKLNAVYSKGGINLLYETIENNFDIKMDGYILVNFEAFENIVNNLNGIEITLTKNEANYLNAKNYISDPKNRNVVEGTQIMNGNQVLGYCRVRYVSTGTENNDFGRTQRHRIVLNSIFNKVKKLNVFQLTSFMNNVLSDSNITTDISQKDFNNYLEQLLDILGEIKLYEYRIPSDGTYEDQKVLIGSKKRDVLIPKDWNSTRKDIKDFIDN